MTPMQSLLAEHPFFVGMRPEYLERLAASAREVNFASSTSIFLEGAPATHFYVLRSGHVALEIHAAERGDITIETIGTGETLGWSWLFPPYMWHFAARAVEPTLAIALDAAMLRDCCEADHDFGYELMRRTSAVIIERLQATRLRLLDVYGAPPRNGATKRGRP